MTQHQTAVFWARWGLLSRLTAQFWPMRRPPILVLSFPRSGSSWVGETLGTATNACYLREPVTQGNVTLVDKGSVFSFDTRQTEANYRKLADKAFLGWPDFGSDIALFPDQWRLRQRRQRFVVIKEINPFAIHWYLRLYQPRLIFIVRHPAAVASSFHRLGWIGAEPGAWAENARLQGQALRVALDALEHYPACIILFYETLCADPSSHFERLCAFTGLLWDDWLKAFVRQTTREGDENDPWQITRNSRRMIDSWRDKVTAEQLAAVKNSYRQFDLPWYQNDADW